ncbi:hypothetical protein L506_0176 [Bordetella bronchiseptica GA96-01]|nr:hypothetical protein L489_0200 [Bordetella bronchiseptica 00-P-2730]KCV40543.1 hypothetical protein L572_0240 [Bordetella bronchiseptica 345]KDC35263.1 hypothetical protein L506_0176 [Bordetella bronchiseptica GA96-01]KDD99310.1 hypothetical protein L535_0165 [Bordetella bronchiseptica SBL-F6116]CFT94252.1 Uncharacterised protein [Bordetella pertussis]
MIPAMQAAIAWKSDALQWAAVRPPPVELDAARPWRVEAGASVPCVRRPSGGHDARIAA